LSFYFPFKEKKVVKNVTFVFTSCTFFTIIHKILILLMKGYLSFYFPFKETKVVKNVF